MDFFKNSHMTLPLDRLGSLLLCAGVLGGLLTSPARADGPLRGNPVDSIPALPNPTEHQPLAPALVPGDAQAQRQQALAARLNQIITPRHFNVSGNTAIALTDIAPLLSPLVGKPITVRQLTQEVDKITQLYQSQGYLLSFALLQNQDFANDAVAVTVVEGYVSQVDFQGQAGPAQSRLQSLAQPLLQQKPLTRAVLERVLNLMRMVPGVKVQPELSLPKHVGGNTPLTLHVERRAVKGEGGVADLGSGLQPLVGITTGSLTPLGEQVRITGSVPIGSHDVQYVSGQVTVPIAHNGLAVVVDGYHYEAHPDDSALSQLGLDRRVVNERVGVGLRYPLLLNNQRSLTVEGGIYASRSLDEYHRDSDNLWFNQQTDLRVLRAGFTYKDTTEKQSRSISVNVYHGLDGLGAKKSYETNVGGSPQVLDFPGKLDFTRYTLDATQSLALPHAFGLTLSGFGQYSLDMLPSTEQTSFGAWRYGLGYSQGVLAGDKGYGVSLEFNRKFQTGWKWVSQVQPYLKVDHARAWYNNAVDRFGIDPRNPKLSSAAIGARITDNRYYVIDFNVAQPIGDLPVNQSRGVRANATYSLLYN
jgi:hemolysin activation/secretion protein